MSTASATSLRIISLLSVLLTMLTPWLHSQTASQEGLPVVEGRVWDSQKRPIAGVAVSLENAEPGHTVVFTTDAQGRFRFEPAPVGTYTLRAKREGYQEAREGSFVLHARETKSIDLVLADAQPVEAARDASATIEFSAEPAFTVAGVTDTTALGGHGSNRVLPSSNALAKEAASLAREGTRQPNGAPHDSEHSGPTSEATLRAALAHEDTADLHAQLAEIEESEGRPLEAVKDYQRAAEMQPSEPHLFAWGAELLLHHAPEPAFEVFAKGRRLYPQSSRMLLGLGAARFAEGSKEQAEQIFLEACDLNPSDSTPYLFLGRLQAMENIEPPGWADRMKRFASVHPENAMAHYLYAVALTKQDRTAESFATAEAELRTAIELDPHFGNAYLQLGILCLEREDFPGAIAALQKAIENTALPDDAHYRLAQVYRRTGDTDKARKEIEQFKQLSEQKNKEAERERHEIQQFVYTLRGQGSPPPPSNPDPH
jgi:tetratricopeptide (TPR) repeat protein